MGKLKQPLFRTWLFTYIVFIIISLAFIYQIYNVNINEIKNQINKVNNTNISQIQGAVDSSISGIDSVLSTQIFNQVLLDFLSYVKDVNDIDPYTLYEINNDLRQFETSINIIDTLYVYAYETNIVIGARAVYKEDTQSILLSDDFHLSKERFDALASQIHYKKIFRLSDLTGIESDDKRLIFLHSIPVNMKEPTGLIMAELDYKSVDTVFQSEEDTEQESFYIIDGDDYIVYSNGQLLENVDIDLDEMTLGETNVLVSNEETYYVYVSESKVNKWKYVHIVDEDEYLSSSKEIRTQSVVIVLMFSFLSLMLAYVITYYVHKPITRLMKRLKPQNSYGKVNEFDIIEQVLVDNEKNQMLMANEIHKQDRVLRKLVLTKWLHGSYETVDEIKEQFGRFKINFAGDYFQVISIRVNTFIQVDQSASHSDNFELTKFIIMNVYDELLTTYVSHEILEVDDLIIGVLNYNSVHDENREIMKQVFYQGKEIVQKNYGIELTMSISDIHEGILGAGVAYIEAQESLAYNAILGELEIVEYRDLLSPAKKYEYSLELEYKLINLLKAGEEADAVDLVENLMRTNTSESLVSIESLKCLLFNVMGSIMKAVQTVQQQEEIERLEPIEALMAMNQVDAMQGYINEVIGVLCKIVIEEKEEQAKDKLEDKVENFIKANYSDVDLNVAMVAEAFSMSTPYISKVFKQGKGITILNFIHNTRINAAKELLSSTNKTISRIGEEVGFTYSHVFIRLFKKETGITPGQYRENN